MVPDLPGCTSSDSTTDEALRSAVEAVRLWAEDAIDDGEVLPPPRSVEALRADLEITAALVEGAALAIVPLLLDAGRAVRANLSLDAGLLDAIDEAATAYGLTRSAFLARDSQIGAGLIQGDEPRSTTCGSSSRVHPVVELEIGAYVA